MQNFRWPNLGNTSKVPVAEPQMELIDYLARSKPALSRTTHSLAYDVLSDDWIVQRRDQESTEDEEKMGHFTIITISGGSPDSIYPEMNVDNFLEKLRVVLARTYYYYIHGPTKLLKKINELNWHRKNSDQGYRVSDTDTFC